MKLKIINKLLFIFRSLLTGCYWYTKDIFSYRSLLKRFEPFGSFHFMPRIFDKDPASHTFDKHYVYMDRWAFKHLLENRPKEHADVGSSIRFLSMASALTQLKFVDIRPVRLDFNNFECIQGSILQLPFADHSVESLSCLHVAEHIGLGRYGDPLDPGGTIKACRELERVLAPGGRLYFALPVGKPATYFNAHRVHNPKTILEYFSRLKLTDFATVNDLGRFIANANIHDYENATYACGMFGFIKI